MMRRVHTNTCVLFQNAPITAERAAPMDLVCATPGAATPDTPTTPPPKHAKVRSTSSAQGTYVLGGLFSCFKLLGGLFCHTSVCKGARRSVLSAQGTRMLGGLFFCSMMEGCSLLCDGIFDEETRVCVYSHMFVFIATCLCLQPRVCVYSHMFVFTATCLCLQPPVCVYSHLFVFTATCLCLQPPVCVYSLPGTLFALHVEQ